MGGQIATAFVRVRPEMSGFKSETEHGVRGAFSGLAKIAGAAFAIGGAAEAVKKIGEAATADQAAFAVLDKTLNNAHSATTLYGQSIDELIKKQAKLRGFSDEELASSFVRLVSATKDTGKAYRDLGLAEDVARSRHIGVAQAALAISKAEQGVTTSLQRLGIIIRPVTASQDALRRSHDEAVASGAKFSKQQDILYKQALAQAAAQDKVASRAQGIAILQQRFGGVAKTFADTASGAWARLQEQVHLFEVFLGERFLPGFTNAVTSVGSALGKLSENQGFRNSLNTIFSDLRAGVDAVKGPLQTVAQAAVAVDHALGGTTILAAVVAYKAFGAAVSLAETAQKKWAAARVAAAAAQAGGTAADEAAVSVETAFARAVAATAAAQIAATEALIENTAARTANDVATASGVATLRAVDAALGGDIAATTADTEATTLLTAAKVRLAEVDTALGAATAASTAEQAASAGVLTTLRSGVLGLVGGPIGALTIGVAGLAAGIVYLATRQSAWDKANRATADSLGALNDAVARTRNLRQERTDTAGQVASDQISVRQARLGVAQARQALATTSATRGSLEYQQAVLNVAQAVQQYRSALQALAGDQRHAGTLAKDYGNQLDQNRQTAKSAVAQISALADAARRQAQSFDSARGSVGKDVGPVNLAKERAQALELFVRSTAKLADGQKGLAAANTALLSEFAQQVGRLPTRHETRIILSNLDATASLNDLITRILPQGAAGAASAGAATGRAYSTALAGALTGPPDSIFVAPFRNAAREIDRLSASYRRVGVQPFVAALERQRGAFANQSPLLAHNIGLLIEYAEKTKKIPPSAVTKLILDNKDATLALQTFVQTILPEELRQAGGVAYASGHFVGDQWVSGLDSSLGGAASGGLFDSIGKLLSGVKKDTSKTSDAANKANARRADDAAAAAKAIAQAGAAAVDAARQNLSQVSASAKDALDQAKQSVSDAQQSLAETIRQGQTQITDAVTSAKQNLFTIGQRLASDIQTFLDKKSDFAPLTGAAVKQFKRLSALINSGAGGPDVQRAATALSAQLQAATAKQALAGPKKDIVQQQVNDLVDQFNKGPQTAAAQKRFNAGIAKILKVDKVTRAAVVKEFGIAFWDDLQAQLQGTRRQAAATAAGPRRRGSGQEPSIVRPEQTVIDVQRQVAAAQRQVSQSQLAEAKQQTTQLKAIAKATKNLDGKVKAANWDKTQLGKKAAAARAARTKVKQ